MGVRGSTVDRYAVFGHPISHSRSPWIHTQFAAQTGQSLVYTAVDIAPDQFEAEVGKFFEEGGRGLNITVPYKERAWAAAINRSPAVTIARAANTLFLDANGELCAENTDGVGLLTDLVQNHGAEISGKRILVLGAGGAVRGVLPALLEGAPRQVCILNRTFDKAQTLANLFAGDIDVSAIEAGASVDVAFDFIINGTSAGLSGDLPVVPEGSVDSNSWCYDMVYGRGETAFQKWARLQSARKSLDGLGMLVEQAARAFLIWRGVSPDTRDVIERLRNELA